MQAADAERERPLSKVAKMSRNPNNPTGVAKTDEKEVKQTFDKKGDWSLMTASR